MERSKSFLGYADDLRSKGLSEKQIADGLDISIADLRNIRSIAKNEVRAANSAQALRLRDKGLSNVAIGRQMGIPESSVRSLLDPAMADKQKVLSTTTKMLKEKMGDGYLDIGSGTENHLGISAYKLSTAVAALKEEGYVVHNVQVKQLGTANKTTIQVLAPNGTTYGDIVRNMGKIRTVAAYSENGGRSYIDIKPPVNISSKRIGVRYAEDGGSKADGVIYVRPGVPDVALGAKRYAQVRIAVDGTHYLKGMAMYKDDLPEGVDLLFNTNKNSTGNKLDVMKSQKDEENPFGTTVRQINYQGKDGKEHLSPMNIVNEEGDWRTWGPSLSSQFLSKQSTDLARQQLDLALKSKREEFEEISRLTNPVVKAKLLQTFADSADSAAVHLKAAALPRQGTHVILPIPEMKANEVYAPNFRPGEKVVLIRHPHGGTFEIPELTVNNKNPTARRLLGTHPQDAIGIHPDVAKRLSGADFDGDTVLVIPNNRRQIKTSPALKGLENFDPQRAYPAYPGMKPMGATPKQANRNKQMLMGDVSNLITDMTIKGAAPEEIAAAVRHSMVVIDADKHNLNYRQSYIDNRIASLKEKYQGRGTTGRLAGASTIVSRAKSEVRLPARKLRPAKLGGPINPATGEKVYVPSDKAYVNKQGKTIIPKTTSTRLAEAKNAFELVSKDGGTPIEHIYAAHSNSLKALANEARKARYGTKKPIYSPSANKAYAPEVKRLTHALHVAVSNRPLERQAQLVANARIAARLHDNPGMDDEDLKKLKGQELIRARVAVGAKKHQIEISPREWEAIQAGAISGNRLADILDNADLDKVKALATPRQATVVTASRLALAKARLASGYTQAEVADSLGISVSTLNSALHREGG